MTNLKKGPCKLIFWRPFLDFQKSVKRKKFTESDQPRQIDLQIFPYFIIRVTSKTFENTPNQNLI
ncbi:hypothetical protein BpHYR1_053838 [Brachionus plicatilis]|uniref:Uncharacterized protein n=1 Tax=Brachionus plicatilis TaxID=10195 RepID=A0A3M7R4L6_BRAPC|nr:hypothetical protein BpHYR1_053838 [Brachionus plicatilis]